MHLSFSIPLLTLLATTTLVTALPASPSYAKPSKPIPTAKPDEFFLVTSDQSERSPDTSQLRGVSATTPFQDDPLSASLVLRLLPPGYNILPAFNLTTSNTLSTILDTGRGKYTYDTAPVVAGQQLQFLPETRTEGNIALKDGYLVTVDGASEGWSVCKTERGTELLYWRGGGLDCKATWVQAVSGAPYRKV